MLTSIAVRAHERRAPVTLVGDIETIGQRWRITEASDLQIIDDTEDGHSGSQLSGLE